MGTLRRVNCLGVHDGELVAGTNAAGSGVVRWHGNAWVTLGGDADSSVYALLSHQGGIYTGGSFGQAGPLAANRAVRWDGEDGSALNSAIDGAACALSDLYVDGFE